VAETAIVVPVLEAEPLVGEWRRRHTPSGAEGMPAHVTLLVPFMDSEALTDGRVRETAKVLEAFAPFDLVLARFAYFPDGVLYLEPTPPQPFREMVAALVAAFPEHPPYGGAFPDPVPHVTVATDVARGEFEAIEQALADGLPVRSRVDEAWLFVHERERWVPTHRFRLRG
jgi:2'-5' RNA ligase